MARIVTPTNIAHSATAPPEEDSLDFVTILATAVDYLASKIHMHVSDVRRLHNIERCVNDLPPELLLQIIDHSLMIRGPRISRLEDLASVCKHWGDLLTSTPTAWSIITPLDPHQDVVKALRRAKSARLDIGLNGWKMDRPGRYSVPTSVARVVDLAEQWRSVDLTLMGESMDQVNRLVSATVPSLEIFKLKVKSRNNQYLFLDEDQEPHMETVHFFGGRAPKLRVLHLAGVMVPYGAEFMKGLEDLQLDSCRLPSSVVFCIIGTSDNLHRLAIGRVIAASFAHTSNFPLIRRDNLNTLILGFDDRDATASYLFPHLDLPNLTTISAAFVDTEPANTLMDGARDTLLHAVRHVSSYPLPRIEITWAVGFHGFSFELKRSSDGYKARCTVPSNSASPAVWVRGALDLMEAIVQNSELCLEIEGEDPKEELEGEFNIDRDLLRLFGHLPQVKRLNCLHAVSSGIFEAMAQPVETEDGLKWLFPVVDALHVVDHRYSDLDVVLEMTKNRYNATMAPIPFKLVELPRWTEGSEMAQEMEFITGLDVLYKG